MRRYGDSQEFPQYPKQCSSEYGPSQQNYTRSLWEMHIPEPHPNMQIKSLVVA